MKPADRTTAEGILFTDQYQLTMAQLYFRMGMHERRAQFEHFFRTYPNYGSHSAGYAINAGMEWLLDWMKEARFRDEDLAHLKTQTTRTGSRVFGDDFLAWLRVNGNFDALKLRAIPEGRVVHPYEPLTMVEGPLAMAQILETALLNKLNYPILIATKAARIREVGRGQMVLEFGLRRSQDLAGNAGARAALIGGADFTSNVGMSHVLGFPPRGTHAHSMIQAFIALGEGELGAFRAYADVYPDDCVLLVDTINTLESGIPNAIKVFEELKRAGHQPIGVRLDSGDLAHLAIQAAKMLDAAGFPDTTITLSNQLDELIILQLISQVQEEAPRYGVSADALIKRLVYGVGTRLIVSEGDSALDGVFKLVSLEQHGEWIPAIKISETPAKTLNPGSKRVWRIYDKRKSAVADVIALDGEDLGASSKLRLRHPSEASKTRVINAADVSSIEPLQVEVWNEGSIVGEQPDIAAIRAIRQADTDRLDLGVKRMINPHIYHVSLSDKLWNLKQELIDKVRHNSD